MGEKKPGCKSGIFSVPSTRRMDRVRGVRDDDLNRGMGSLDVSSDEMG